MAGVVLSVLAAWLLIGLAVGILVGKCIHAGMASPVYEAPVAKRQAA